MIGKIDTAIMRRVKNIADAVDYRWHINTYMIASYIYRFVSFCVIGVIGLDFIEHKSWAARLFLIAVNIPISLLVMWQSDRMKEKGQR